MPKIAISYRREDSIDITGRICDRLSAHFGRDSVFRDIDSLRPGFDFRDQLTGTLERCELLIVVMGPQWVGHMDGGATRIAHEGDFVRFEVETALKRTMPIIPVLVGRAHLPNASDLPESIRNLVYRHAITISSGRDFEHHSGELIRAIEDILGVGRADVAASTPDHPGASGPAAESAEPPSRGPGTQGPLEPAATLADAAPKAAAANPRGENLWRVMACALIAQALLSLTLYMTYLAGPLNIARIWNLTTALLSLIAGAAMLFHLRWRSPGLLVACLCGLGFEAYWLANMTFRFVPPQFQFSIVFSCLTFLLGLVLLLSRRRTRAASL